MVGTKHKYLLIGILVAACYWLIDSSVHLMVYGEGRFEIVPSEINELWMRLLIVSMIIGFGIYVEISFRKRQELYNEKFRLQLDLDDSLTALLGGYMVVCQRCRKICTREDGQNVMESWQDIDSYLSHYAGFKYGRGTCPDCIKKEH